MLFIFFYLQQKIGRNRYICTPCEEFSSVFAKIPLPKNHNQNTNRKKSNRNRKDGKRKWQKNHNPPNLPETTTLTTTSTTQTSTLTMMTTTMMNRPINDGSDNDKSSKMPNKLFGVSPSTTTEFAWPKPYTSKCFWLVS